VVARVVAYGNGVVASADKYQKKSPLAHYTFKMADNEVRHTPVVLAVMMVTMLVLVTKNT